MDKFEDRQKKFKELFFEKCSLYYSDNLKIGFGYIDYGQSEIFVPYTKEHSITEMMDCAYLNIPKNELVRLIEEVKQNLPEIYALEQEYIHTAFKGIIADAINRTNVSINRVSFRDEGNSFVNVSAKGGEEFARSFVVLWEVALARVSFSAPYQEGIIPFVFFDKKTKTIFAIN